MSGTDPQNKHDDILMSRSASIDALKMMRAYVESVDTSEIADLQLESIMLATGEIAAKILEVEKEQHLAEAQKVAVENIPAQVAEHQLATTTTLYSMQRKGVFASRQMAAPESKAQASQGPGLNIPPAALDEREQAEQTIQQSPRKEGPRK